MLIHILRSWGEGRYPRPHGVHMAPDDTMFLTDDGGHFVRKVTLILVTTSRLCRHGFAADAVALTEALERILVFG